MNPATQQPARVEYWPHVRLWCVIHADAVVMSYRTRQAAQRLMNRINGEETL